MEDCSWLFRFAIRMLKYFLLGLFGLAVACFLSVILDVLPVLQLLLSVMSYWLFRVGAVVTCLMAAAIVTESAR